MPELGVAFPSNAIGKDYLTNGSIVERAPSGTGFQVSLFGVLGFLIAWDEGLEFNLFGLNFGIDPLGPALKLPFIGRLGFNLNRPAMKADDSGDRDSAFTQESKRPARAPTPKK